ncbi:SpoIIE family protein phosphatase [Streptomyces sp. NPDC046977]|uniref:SpoIIE family protein phosphatase n=1 Tax=Streptomyces sp. NPDC046977 TaxID=3154703 RepID=UPI0033C0D244
MTTSLLTSPESIVQSAAAGSGPALEALLTRSPVGLALWGTDLRCTWANATLERQDGIPGDHRLGRRPSEALRGDSCALEAVMAKVLRTGTPALSREYRHAAAGRVGNAPAYSVSFFRLDDPDGSVRGVCSLVLQAGGRRSSGERLALLSEASTRVGTTLDAMRTGQELADFTVPFLADYAAVDLVEAVHLGEEPPHRAFRGGDGGPVFRRAGLASVRPGAPEARWGPGEVVTVPETSPFTEVLASRRPVFEPVLGDRPGGRPAGHPVLARAMREHGMHSVMVVPVQARGIVLGVAAFVRTVNPAPFEEDDMLLAEQLVARAALSLDNARRYARERATALALQRSLLPRAVSGGAAVDAVSRYLPADIEDGVGGDWYDVIPLPGARVALVVGDVAGHGINAAATMGRLRTAVHTLADMDLAPGELLAHLDEVVGRLADEETGDDADDTCALATCLYAVYDPATRRCVMARAGHPPPAVLLPDGRVEFPDLPDGTPLGLGVLPYESAELELPEGSVIALYTDGLVEDRRQDIDVGMDRMAAALARPGLPLDDLCAEVMGTLRAGAAPRDDVTLLLARTRALSPEDLACWELPADPAAVGAARSLAARQLDAWGLESVAETTQMIVSELVTNAVVHTPGPVRLRLIRHQVLVVEVADRDNNVPRTRRAGVTDEGGRGLYLVARLGRRWGTRLTPEGKLVWAEQELPPPASAEWYDGTP